MRTPIFALAFAALIASPLIGIAPQAAHALQAEEETEIEYGKVITGVKVGEWVTPEKIENFDKSKVYLIDIWSPAANACKRSLPMLHELAQELKDEGLVLFGVTADKKSAVEAYMLDKKSFMTHPIALSRDGGGGQTAMWRKFARSGLLPISVIVNREGQVCYIGSPFDHKFTRVLHLALADRYNTRLLSEAQPIVGAARRAAKIRNYREANRLYSQVVALSPKQFADVALEQWRMIAEQAADLEAAKVFVRALIDSLGNDASSLVFVGDYLATNTEGKHRDLEAAKIVAEKLRTIASSNAAALACIASIEAAAGDFEAATESQYDAWLAASPSNKAAFKRSLDLYRKGQMAPKPVDPEAAKPAVDTAGEGADAGTTPPPEGAVK